MKVYKVVGKNTNVSVALAVAIDDDPEQLEFLKLETARDEQWVKAFKYYFKEYTPGKLVKSLKTSKGIFCFSNIACAERFQDGISTSWKCTLKILEVNGIGRSRKPVNVVGITKANVLDITKYSNKINIIPNVTSLVPEGTICFPSIKVIGELNNENSSI